MSWRFLLGLFLCALAIRGAVAIARPPLDDGDQRLYRQLATSMAEGRGYVLDGAPKTTVHPLLPTLHAALLRVAGDAGATGLVLTLLIGSLVPVVGARATGLLLGARAGVVAGALLALAPHHVLASARLEPDLLAAALGFWVVAATWRGDLVLAGIAVGLGYLTRPELILLAPAAAVVARLRGARLLEIARLLAAALAVSAVFLLFVHAAIGRWALSGKDHWQYYLGVHQWRTRDQPQDPATIPGLAREIRSPLHHLATRPGEFLLGYAYRSLLLARNVARQLGFVLVPFAIAGLVRAWRTSREAFLCLLIPLAPLPVYPLVGTFFRHSLVPGSIFLALAGVGLAAVRRPSGKLPR